MTRDKEQTRRGGYDGRKDDEMKKSLRDRAFATELHSRFVAREDDLGRDLTDEEVKAEAQYQLETIPYSGNFEGSELRKVVRQLKALLR